MDAQQFTDSYILANKDNLPAEKLYLVRDKLSVLPETRQAAVQSVPFKSPITTLILSLFLGGLGVDRFYIGDVGLGILKLLTLGGLGFWALADLYFSYKKTKEKNFQNLMLAL